MTPNITVVILAAGLGTRMKSKKAKVLHEAGGDTLLNQVIRAALHVAAPEQIVTVVGYQAEQVRQSVKVPGIRFAEQTEQKGTGHAVLCARQSVASENGDLLILNGDGPLLKASTLQALLALHRTQTSWRSYRYNRGGGPDRLWTRHSGRERAGCRHRRAEIRNTRTVENARDQSGSLLL